MADKTVIVEIQYDTDGAVQSLDKLTSTIEGEKVAQQQLKAELESGQISQKKYSEEVAKSKEEAGKANKERNATIKLLGAEKGSIDQVKARMKQLEIENGKLNRTSKEGNAQFQKNNKELKALSKNLKAAKDDTGKATGAFGKLGKNMSAIKGPLGGVASGIGGMTKAALAFIATPLGAIIAAIVIALKALMSFFKGSEEGQNKLNKIMAIGGAIIGNLGDTFRDFGELVFNSLKVLAARFTKFFANISLGWQKVKGVFKDNTAAIEEQRKKIAEADKVLTERQNERKKSTEELKNGLKGIIEETKKEIGIAKKLADRQAALDLLQRGFLVERAKLEAEIAKNLTKSKDKEKFSAEERVKFLQEAIDKENEILATNEKITKEKLALKKAQNTLSDSTKEDLNEEAQLEADLFNVQKENSLKRKLLTSQLLAAQKEITAEIKKQEAAEQKLADEREKLQQIELERRADAIAKMAKLENDRLVAEAETFETRKELLVERAEQELELKLELIGITQEEIELAEAEHKARLLEIDAEYNAQIDVHREANLQSAFASMQKIIAATNGMADKRVSIISDAFSKITTIDFKELESSKDKFIAIAQAASGLTALITAGHEQELADLEAQKAHELSFVGDNKEAQDAINVKFAKKQADLKTKQAKDDKNAALIDATIATALGVVSALANSGNPILGIIMAALVGVLGGVQIAAIASQPTPKFVKGGIIGGNTHLQGGTKFFGQDGSTFEAEKGEAMFIMKKDATAEIAALSMINESFGGRSFTGKGSAHLQEGGEVDSANIDQQVSEAIQRTPIIVGVESIEAGFTAFNSVKEAGVI